MPNSVSLKKFLLKKWWLRLLIFLILCLIAQASGPARELGWINSIVYVVEDFSILISVCIFIIYYSLRSRLKDLHSHLIGTGFLIIGGLDFYRSVTSPDVTPLFQSATWLLHHELVGVVFDLSLLLMLGLVFIPQNRQIKINILQYSIPIAVLIVSLVLSVFIIHPSFLPAIYQPNVGRTTFYFYSKLITVGLFIFCSYQFFVKSQSEQNQSYLNRFHQERLSIKYLNLSIAARFFAAAVLCMVFYNFDNDLNDQLLEICSFIFKMLTYVFIYRAVIKTTLLVPFLENESFATELKNKISNITELENELNNTRKLAVLGQQVDSIAHDLGNMLMMIAVGNDKFLELEDYSQIKENVESLHSKIHKSKNYLTSLIRFTKRIDQPLSKLKISLFIDDFKKNIGPIISVNKINLESASVCDCEIIMVPSDLEQILLNLVFNAKDAIVPKVGTISISSKFEYINSKQDVFGKAFIDGNYCVISVTDTGKGIAKENWKEIFDPFNTTKSSDKNFGLGLVTVLNIVNKYNGYITIESELERGTTFSTYISLDHKNLGTLAILNSQL